MTASDFVARLTFLSFAGQHDQFREFFRRNWDESYATEVSTAIAHDIVLNANVFVASHVYRGTRIYPWPGSMTTRGAWDLICKAGR